MHYRPRPPIGSRWLPSNLQDIAELRYGKLGLSENVVSGICVFKTKMDFFVSCALPFEKGIFKNTSHFWQIVKTSLIT